MLLQGSEEERGPHETQVHCSMFGGFGQPVAPHTLVRAAPLTPLQQWAATVEPYVTPHSHGGTLWFADRSVSSEELRTLRGQMAYCDAQNTEQLAGRTRVNSSCASMAELSPTHTGEGLRPQSEVLSLSSSSVTYVLVPCPRVSWPGPLSFEALQCTPHPLC